MNKQTKTKQELVADMLQAMQEISSNWEQEEDDVIGFNSEKSLNAYPFKEDFNELINKMYTWKDSLSE